MGGMGTIPNSIPEGSQNHTLCPHAPHPHHTRATTSSESLKSQKFQLKPTGSKAIMETSNTETTSTPAPSART